MAGVGMGALRSAPLGSRPHYQSPSIVKPQAAAADHRPPGLSAHFSCPRSRRLGVRSAGSINHSPISTLNGGSPQRRGRAPASRICTVAQWRTQRGEQRPRLTVDLLRLIALAAAV